MASYKLCFQLFLEILILHKTFLPKKPSVLKNLENWKGENFSSINRLFSDLTFLKVLSRLATPTFRNLTQAAFPYSYVIWLYHKLGPSSYGIAS